VIIDRRQTDNNLPILFLVNAIYKKLILKGYGWDLSTEEKKNGLSVLPLDPS